MDVDEVAHNAGKRIESNVMAAAKGVAKEVEDKVSASVKGAKGIIKEEEAADEYNRGCWDD